jgi:hypothetical protein
MIPYTYKSLKPTRASMPLIENLSHDVDASRRLSSSVRLLPYETEWRVLWARMKLKILRLKTRL